MKELLKKYFTKGISYQAYTELIQSLYEQGKATGDIQNEDYLHYTQLSIQRMNRWNKKAVLSEEAKSNLATINQPQNWLVIAEGWCGDAAHALPFIYLLASASEKIELKIVLRDENDELMQEFLTNGGKSIPKLIAFTPEHELLFTWGPRPKEPTAMVMKEKDEKGKLDESFKTELQKWFNKDKGNSTVNELIELASEAVLVD